MLASWKEDALSEADPVRTTVLPSRCCAKPIPEGDYVKKGPGWLVVRRAWDVTDRSAERQDLSFLPRKMVAAFSHVRL